MTRIKDIEIEKRFNNGNGGASLRIYGYPSNPRSEAFEEEKGSTFLERIEMVHLAIELLRAAGPYVRDKDIENIRAEVEKALVKV